jgi:hypothetical protein
LPEVPPSPLPGLMLPPSLVSLDFLALIGSHDTVMLMHLPRTAASEVSSILEGRISGASTGGELEETGRVLSEWNGCLLVHC